MADARAAVDEAGRIETRGIDYIPENERHSSPRNLFTVLAGAQFCFTLFVWGWLPVTYGLGWWSIVTSTTIGLAVGSLLVAPIALFGPRTGTNTAVSSGAFFGVVGRLVGSVVALFIAIGAYALTIWTSGQAIIAAAHRLFGWSDGTAALAIGYAVITLITITLAIYGHASLVAVQKYAAPVMGLVIIAGFFVLLPHFHAGYHGGHYILGSFWPTWLLSVVTAISASMSYGPFLNDYSRYISVRRTSNTRVALGAGLGIFVGLWITVMFAAYAATIFTNPDTDFTFGLVAISPGWYLVPLLAVGLVGSFGQGSLALYGTGLDTSSIFPRLSRVSATAIVSAAGAVFVYLGSFVWNALDLVSAFITILTIITGPWVAILLIGYWVTRGNFTPADLQLFNKRQRGGRYWYKAGWNPVALSAWCIAVVVGLLFSQNSLYVGPFADAAGGVDLSFVISLVLGGGIYSVAVLRHREVAGWQPPGLGHSPLAAPAPPNVSAADRVDRAAESTPEGSAS
jgi:purine-cytosine permease-like protein